MFALLLIAQGVEFNVAKPFEHCMQIGAAMHSYGDWDRDGHADFLISAPTAIFESIPTVALVSGKDGHGLLVLRGDKYWFGSVIGTCANIDDDERPEIVVSSSGGSIVCSSKDGKTLYELHGIDPTEVADLDGDGHRDWIVRSHSVGVPAKREQTFYQGGVETKFQVENTRERLDVVSGKTGAVLRGLVGDREPTSNCVELRSSPGKDGIAMLTCARASRALASAKIEILHSIDGTPGASRTLDFVSDEPVANICATSDVNHDGTTDLVLSMFDDTVNDAMGDSTWPRGEVFVLSGRDLSTIRELKPDHPVARFGYSIDAGADLDKDGTADILTTECGDLFVASTRFVLRAFSGSDGHLLHGHSGGPSFGACVKFVGDTDGDGTVDYAVSDVYLSDATTTEPGSVMLFSGRTGEQLLNWKR